MTINLEIKSSVFKYIFFGCCIFLTAFCCVRVSSATEDEKTYSISLVKTAKIDKDIREVDNKKVLVEEHALQEGEWVWKVLRERGLLKKHNLAHLLSVLKKLNKSLGNLDMVHPGDKIIIPLKIVPIAGGPSPKSNSPVEVTPVTAIKDISFENYTVQKNDILARVVKGLYHVPSEKLYDEYLELVKRLNPSIKDLDIIYPGQVISLPIYSPKIIRKPINAAIRKKFQPSSKHNRQGQRKDNIAEALGKIFFEMGEKYIQTGELFIPLKSVGQVNLMGVSFPSINLKNDQMVIVDLNNNLPDNMVKLIKSSWDNYQVIHIVEKDDLRSALEKILRACNYPGLRKRGEPFEMKGDTHLIITGDWIITPPKNRSDTMPSLIVINLTGNDIPNTPWMIKDYLKNLGVKVIDYPLGDDGRSEKVEKVKTLEGGEDTSSLVATLLKLIGRPFSTDVKIPVYQSHDAGFNMIIKSDFFLKIEDKDAIIDLTGLDAEVISFLKEHRFLMLPLASEKGSLTMVAKLFDFLGIQYNPGPHSFSATNRDDSRNIKLTLPGIVFSDTKGNDILASPMTIPDELVVFLSQKGYKILPLSFP